MPELPPPGPSRLDTAAKPPGQAAVAEPVRGADDALGLLEAVTRAVNEADTVEAAFARTLALLCDYTAWPVGHAYLTDAATGELAPTGVWHLPDAGAVPDFRARAAATRFAPGMGVLGRVALTREPAWLEDAAADPAFLRASAASGLRAGFMLPVLVGDEVAGVLECYADHPAPRDDALLTVLLHVGIQLGRAVERSRARAARQAAETALSARAEELARSNAELEQFAYVASHDLQEPLRMVGSYAQLLARKYAGRLDEQADRYIAYLVEGAERMHVLITDVLALSRVGTQGKPFVPTDAGAVLQRALRRLGGRAAEAGGEVTSDSLPIVVADAGQLEQLFQNLVGNALKFHRPGEPPRVHVSAAEAEDVWHFTVRDEGIGFEPQFAEQIFVLFQRLHARTEYPGTGIGLALCKKIVERHGGRIWAESAPGAGATFHFTLPRVHAIADAGS